jgi:uncharacterized membrane protein YraQ (UPF0718 family)
MNTNPSSKESVKSIVADLIGVGLLGLFVFLFFNVGRFKGKDAFFSIPDSWMNVNTIFLSIVLEALPFILLGVFISSLIQVYVKDDMIQRFIPKNAYMALVPATLLGAIFPVCECAIIPVVRRLIKKGMPLHIGVVFLVTAPILNPVVAISTYFAFRNNLAVLYSRMGIAFLLAIVIGAIMYRLFKNSNQLKNDEEELIHANHHHHEGGHHHHEGSHHDHNHEHHHHEGDHPNRTKLGNLKLTLYHATDEFFDMGKFLIGGAFIAALFQTFLDRQILLSIGSNEYSSTLVMMGFAYIISLCSEADAFVAASFGGTFTVGSIIAFLVYGPMLDLKNTILYFAFFKAKFVFAFITVVTVTVFVAVMLLQQFIL